MQPTPPTDLTPARCGTTAVHPPHPIDGSAPGVADCDGLMRRATDREIAQANAYTDVETADWDRDNPGFDIARQDVFDRALEVLIHANGGRYTEPAPAVGRCGERAPQFFPTVPTVHCALLAGHPGWHRADDGCEWTDGDAMRPAATDPLVVAVLDAAIVLAQSMPRFVEGGGPWDFSAEEIALGRAVDAMLATCHDLRDQPTEPAPVDLTPPDDQPRDTRFTGPGADRVNDIEAMLAATFTDTPTTPAADLADEAAHERARTEPRYSIAFNALTAALAKADRFVALSERQAVTEAVLTAIDAYRAGPTPTDERQAWTAVHRLVNGLDQRGISVEFAGKATGAADAALAHIDRLTTALNDAARDAHADLEAVYDGLSAEQEIRAHALNAAVGLVDTSDAGDLTRWTLDVASEFAAFIGDGATRDDIEAPDYDEVQKTFQREFAAGYHEAVRRLRDPGWYDRWWQSADHEATGGIHIGVAYQDHLAKALEDTAPDPDDPWADALASTSPRCTCQAGPGEHPHTSRGCDIEDCGCTWTPPAVNEARQRAVGGDLG